MRNIPAHILNKVRGFYNSAVNSIRVLFKIHAIDGTLAISKVFSNGIIEPVVKEQNMIMLLPKRYMLSSIYDSGFVLKIINRLQVGTGGTIDPAGLYPKSVSQSLSSLFTPLLSVTTYTTEAPLVPSITFIADIDQATCNGTLITEAGLLFTDNSLFNIKTFPGIPKTADFSIHFEWTIKVT
jgi:hypothetical protein